MKSGLKELYMLLFICYVLSFVSCATPVIEKTPQEQGTTAEPAQPVQTQASVEPKAPIKVQANKIKSVQPVTAKWLVLKHPHYTIYYDAALRLPRKVEYTLTAENLQIKVAKRKQTKFHEDPLLLDRSVASVKVSEYKGEKGIRSRYDRGHMAPANDFAFSQEAMNDTFVMSNMVPQTPGLNEISWKTLEAQVQRWACGEKKLTVITGPIIVDSDTNAMASGLMIPDRFYKILVDETPPRKAIGFVYSQEDAKPKIHAERIVAVADIARESKIDFTEELKGLPSKSLQAKGDLGEWAEAKCASQRN